MAGVWDEVDATVAADPSKLNDVAPAAQSTVWDSVDSDVKAQQDQENAAAIARSMNSVPDAYAEHMALGKQFGVSVDYVGRNEKALKDFAGFQMQKELLDRNPPLAKWYASDDNAAAIKVDELDHLSGLSWLGASFGQAAVSGYHSTDRAMLRYKQMMGMASGEEIARADQMQADDEPRDYGAETWAQRGWVGAAGQLANMGASMVGTFAGGIQGATAGGAAALVAGQLGPQVALPEEVITVPAAMGTGYALGAKAGSAMATFKMESGNAFEEFSQMKDEAGQPLNPSVARGAAIVTGIVNAGLETLSLQKMASVIPGGSAFMGTLSKDAIKEALMRPTVRAALGEFAKNVGETGVTEVSTEVMQEAMTVFAGTMAKEASGQDFAYSSAGDITKRLGDTFQQTLETMAVMGPMLASTRLGHDVHRSFAAGRDALVLREIANHAEGNPLNERLPEKAKEAVRAITADGPVQHVYIAPEAFSTYFQTSEEASKFAAHVGLTDEYNEAQRTGRDMEVPFDTYYVNIAGTDIGKAIEQHVKFSPDNMSSAEAENFNNDWQEAQQRLQEDYAAGQADDKHALEGEEKVFDDVKTKAMDAGIVPDQAGQYAKLYSTFFRVMAERTGQDANALYQQYGLGIKRALPQETNYKPVDNTDLALEAVRRGRVEPLRKMVEKAAGPSLLDAVIARGGMVDAGGELAAMNAPKRLIRSGTAGGQMDLGGVNPADNQYGADDVTRQMWEEGYFPEFEERPTPNDLFNAIREEMAGNKRHSAMYDQSNEPAVQQAHGLVTFAEMLDKLGLDPSTMSNEEIKKALDEAVNNDPNAGALFQDVQDGAAGNVETLDDIEATAADNGVKLVTSQKGNDVTISMLRADKQGEGKGTAVMQSLTAWADENGKRLLLTPEKIDGTTSAGRLHDFYKRFGFVDNKGKAKDFGTQAGMYREPVSRELSQDDGTKRGSIQIAPGRTVINMFDQADMSTFLHESGHFFLEVFRDLAVANTADEALGHDWQATREYLGITDDANISTESHEKFARTFEAYLFEGKAPSNEVAGIMSRFRSWLAFVYKSVKSLNVPINDKIRGVMDRLIASDSEIAAARQSPDFRPAFKDAAEAGMTEKQWVDYVGVAGRAVERARRELDSKMMQEVARETTREWRTAKKNIREAVTKELSALPVYQAITYLRTGEGGPEGERLHLDRDSIVDVMGEGALSKMPKGTYRVEGGVHPDILAEVLGFKSGHDMLTRMMSVPKIEKAAADETALRMKQQYGDLLGDSVARAREASDAIHNDETGALLNAEIAVLVKKGLATSTVSKADARRAARDMVRSKTVREALRTKLYQNADLKAALEAEKAIRKGDWVAALAAKKRQLVNHYAAMESVQAEKEVTKAVAYLNKFAGRKMPKGIWPEHVARIQQMLERFDLRSSTTLTDEQRNTSFAAWIAAQEAMGEVVDVPDAIRNDAFRKPYRSMTVDDLMAVRDAVQNVEHLGRRWAAVMGDIEAREFNGRVDEAVAAIASGQDKLKAQKTRNPVLLDNVLSNIRSADGSLLKMEQFLQFMDGDDVNGPLSRYVFRPIAEAQHRENDMQREYSAKFADIMGKLDSKRLMERITIAGLEQTFTRSEIMTVALNMGTASNMDKMLRGEGWDKSPGIVNRIVSNLNEAELNAVQETWDMIHTLWPEIAKLYKRLAGVEPGKVEARPIEINGVKLKGGYFPMKYDPRRDYEVSQREAAMTDLMGESTYLKPQTANGFSNERTQSYARPVNFTLEVAGKHIIDVIHDLTHREAIINADRLLQNNAVRSEIIQRYGVERYNQFRPWLQSIANDRRADDGLDLPNRFLRGIRSRATVMGLGLRYSTLIAQVSGYSNSLDKVGVKHLAGAMRDFFGADGAGVFAAGAAAGSVVGGPVLGAAGGAGALAAYTAVRSRLGMANNMITMTRDVMSKSGEMRHRAETRDRDIRAQIRAIEGKETLSAEVQHFAFAGIGYMDMAVTVPTWMAAYREHLAAHPVDEEGAVAHADSVVRLTQGAGGAKDLAAVQRGPEGFKLLTSFYSYFSAYYARQRAWGRDMKQKVMTGEGSFPDLLARQVFLTLVPAVMTDLLLGRGPGDDEPWEAWAAKKIALYPFNAVPLIGPAINSIGSPFGFSLSPAQRTVEETAINPVKLVAKIWEGKATAREVVKQVITTTGYLGKLPLGQVATSVDNVWKALEKDDFQLSDLVVSKPKK